jgi:hypothetical protein
MIERRLTAIIVSDVVGYSNYLEQAIRLGRIVRAILRLVHRIGLVQGCPAASS